MNPNATRDFRLREGLLRIINDPSSPIKLKKLAESHYYTIGTAACDYETIERIKNRGYKKC